MRQQLAVLKHKTKRPKLTNADRAFWVALSHLWPDWRNALILVKPETVIGWHRKGFRLYWTWKSRNRGGRPPIDAQIRSLIRRMARENPTWGAPRIHGELLMLGFNFGGNASTTSSYSESGTYAASFGNTSSTIMHRGHTSHSTKMLRNSASASPSMKAKSSPSRWWAASTIATPASQPEPRWPVQNERPA